MIVMVGCETDVHGTISMLIQNCLNLRHPSRRSGHNEEDNTALLYQVRRQLLCVQRERFLENIPSAPARPHRNAMRRLMTITAWVPLVRICLLIVTGDAVSPHAVARQ
jgi:hypothetical protein